jgi:hypothetical protein
MGCCGNGRVARQINYPAPRPAESILVPPTPARQALHPVNTVLFQYIGKSGMTVFGPITGRRYRFGQPGVIVSIDPRDAPSVDSVPHLQRILAR